MEDYGNLRPAIRLCYSAKTGCRRSVCGFAVKCGPAVWRRKRISEQSGNHGIPGCGPTGIGCEAASVWNGEQREESVLNNKNFNQKKLKKKNPQPVKNPYKLGILGFCNYLRGEF